MNPNPAIGGVYVAAVTPHRDKSYEPDVGAALELVDFLAGAGVNGIALLGSTGEFLHLAFDDRIRLVQLAVKRSRVPVLVGVGHSTWDGAVELGCEAASAGAAGLLLMPPYFFRYGQEDIREFYLQFAAAMAGAAPIFLYNISAFTNEIAIDTAAALLSTGLFAGIKDSSGEYGYFERLLAASQERPFTVLIGNDRIYSRARRMGAHGIVSGVACAVPELLVALEDAMGKNQTARIDRLDARLHEFIDWHDRFPTPVAIKAAAHERGLKTGPRAVPLSPAAQKLLDEFREWFRAWLPLVQREASADVLE
jgi:4-hydroxy-tetrahydrodipicolinate synthase